MSEADRLIKSLYLVKHPEGGYYRETYRSPLVLDEQVLKSFESARNICTSIYFLLPGGGRSLLHRIRSDELWHYHAGCALSIYVIVNDELRIFKLGPNTDHGENFQVIVPANCWFGAIPESNDSFTLAGCTVAPGFDFRDFQLASRSHLIHQFPQFEKEIKLLTRPE